MQERTLPPSHQLIPLEYPQTGWSLRRKRHGKQVFITREANQFLLNLNDYQKNEVYRALSKIVSEGGYGLTTGGLKTRPMAMRSKTDAIAAAGILNLVYSVNSEKIVVNAIGLNKSVVGPMPVASKERAALYEINRKTSVRYSETSSTSDIEKLEGAWGRPKVVVDVNTEHAAVNGMQNDLEKARWLMGVHVDTAYWGDSLDRYTLFHNPTVGFVQDVFECIQDKVGASKLARQLASILVDCQRKGRKVKWVCHSQGGIIFTRAVELVNGMGVKLEGQKVAIHAGGNKKRRAKDAFVMAGLDIVDMDRDSPFDFVPNLAGGNNWSWSSFRRCYKFARMIISSNNPMETSPHTLPFLSLECSIRHLQMNGYENKAKMVIQEQSRLGQC
ncbi:hypothetical protein ONV78_03735 [Hahella sp. CR1]|uniref:hypothetical protein n=1 Tax=Hahella sp. CR1 TaxID=2992807 RepID=UPI0024425A0E|nr:hypothetical protein [Hahella sp. CR1]MDG9666836.1 hypothetical protein [Hahella sp. CR1]